MKCEILHQPSYALAVLHLDTGDEVQAEPGAMVSMSSNVSLQAEVKGGFLGALGRAVMGGESFFTSRYRAVGGPGELTLAPSIPGDIATLHLQNDTLYLQSGAYLAGAAGLDIDTKWQGARGFFGARDLMMLRVRGFGPLLFNAFGALHAKQLAPGERYVVDTGHVVAFTEGMGFHVKKAADGWFSSIASGEMLVCEFTGPGVLYMQTRSEAAFIDWLSSHLPKRS